jgi:TonB family protein
MSRWGALLTVAGMLVLGAAVPAQTGYKLIVNNSNPIDSVSKAQVARFFLENAIWDDGRPASAVDLPPASPIRELFSRDALGMPIPAVLSLWRTVSGSGRGDAPPSMATDREVLAYVRLKPGAIGYVSAVTETAGVKVIALGKSDTTVRSQEPMEVGGSIPMPEKIEGAFPAYPPAAKASRLEGQVDIEVIIGTSGIVEKARVVGRSAPSLDEAAVAAVKQWKYRPTMVNGVAVPVKGRVRISFKL